MSKQSVNLSVHVSLQPFGTFQYTIVHEDRAEETEQVAGEQGREKTLLPPYFLPTATGDTESPVTYWTSAG